MNVKTKILLKNDNCATQSVTMTIFRFLAAILDTILDAILNLNPIVSLFNVLSLLLWILSPNKIVSAQKVTSTRT